MTRKLQALGNVGNTVKRTHFSGIFLCCLFLLLGCSSDDKEALNSEKQIRSFQFEASKNEVLNIDVSAAIDQHKHTIEVIVPFDTDITALKATIAVSDEASVAPDPQLEYDFSAPVVYTVIAQDGGQQAYEVTVRIQEPASDYEVLIALLNANPSHQLQWNLDDTTMVSWQGVTLKDGRVNGLTLINNNISVIPSSLHYLEHLRNLNLRTNNISYIPDEIGQLNQLFILNLSENKIKSLPKTIGNLKKLKGINLFNNVLERIPIEIGEASSLFNVSLRSNALTSIPKEMGNLKELSILNLSGNNLTEIPKEVCDLETNQGTNIIKDNGVSCQ